MPQRGCTPLAQELNRISLHSAEWKRKIENNTLETYKLLYKQLLGIRAKLSNPTSSHSQSTNSRRVRFITWGILLKCRLQSSREMSRKSEGNVISSECKSYNPLEEGAYNILQWVKRDCGWRMKEIGGRIFWLLRFYEPCKLFYGFTKLESANQFFFLLFKSFSFQGHWNNNVKQWSKAESVLQRLEHPTRDSWATEKKNAVFIHWMMNKWMLMLAAICFYSHLYFQ